MASARGDIEYVDANGIRLAYLAEGKGALTFTPGAFVRPKIAVPTVVFSGTDDPNVSRVDYERARRKFTGEYVIE